MKLCKDCKHYKFDKNVNWTDEKHKCLRNSHIRCLITGEYLGKELMCKNERYNVDPDETTRFCGEEGQYWEPINNISPGVPFKECGMGYVIFY